MGDDHPFQLSVGIGICGGGMRAIEAVAALSALPLEVHKCESSGVSEFEAPKKFSRFFLAWFSYFKSTLGGEEN